MGRGRGEGGWERRDPGSDQVAANARGSKGRPRKRFRSPKVGRAAAEKEEEERMVRWLEANPISPAWGKRIDAEMRSDELRSLDNRERRKRKRGGGRGRQ